MALKKFIFCIWLLLIIGGLTLYLFFPEKINLLFLEGIPKKHYLVLAIYFLLLSCRGLTMIPSTPLLLAGILLFSPIEVFVVNMTGILASSTIVYYFSNYLGLAAYFESRYGRYVQRIRHGLEDKELPLIAGWSFFPLVPTDLIIYIGSTLRINVFKCLLGVFVGEAVLNAFYIYFANLILRP